MATLIRFTDPERGMRVGMQIANTIYDVTEKYPSVAAWLRSSVGRAQAAIDEIDTFARAAKLAYLASVLDAPAIPNLAALTVPVDVQDVWGAGVTYERSRDARVEESAADADVYTRVYNAPRPELFFKAQGRHVVGPYAQVGIRKDSLNSVPEPELVLLINPAMEVVGYSVGLDMTARDIESENILYLSQVKIYNASCAIGPGFVLQKLTELPHLNLTMTITRDKATVFEGEINTSSLHRSLESLIDYLRRSNTFADGVALFTGTGIVPPAEFALKAGDVIRTTLETVGTLTNTVMQV